MAAVEDEQPPVDFLDVVCVTCGTLKLEFRALASRWQEIQHTYGWCPQPENPKPNCSRLL